MKSEVGDDMCEDKRGLIILILILIQFKNPKKRLIFIATATTGYYKLYYWLSKLTTQATHRSIV